jgi:DNA invertase Pin-like site-specific DNA recombinase
MRTFGYCRVSTKDQNDHRQLLAMGERGIPPERIFSEKLSGKDTKRPALQSLMNTVQKGDAIVVESISRFARNTKDLLVLVEKLTAKGVEFISLKEHIDTTTPTGRFMLTIFAAVAELEREYTLQLLCVGILASISILMLSAIGLSPTT